MKIDADRIDLLLETIGELVIMESIVNRMPRCGKMSSGTWIEIWLNRLNHTKFAGYEYVHAPDSH